MQSATATAPAPSSLPRPTLDHDTIATGLRNLARLARIAEQACQSSGISLPQYRLLDSLRSGPRRASELAATVGVSRPTLTSLVDGLARRGLLERHTVATDRRGVYLERTEEGTHALADAEKSLVSSLAKLVPPESFRSAVEVIQALDRAFVASDS